MLIMNMICFFGPLAQRLEQRTHNPLVVGSNPTGAIIHLTTPQLSPPPLFSVDDHHITPVIAADAEQTLAIG